MGNANQQDAPSSTTIVTYDDAKKYLQYHEKGDILQELKQLVAKLPQDFETNNCNNFWNATFTVRNRDAESSFTGALLCYAILKHSSLDLIRFLVEYAHADASIFSSFHFYYDSGSEEFEANAIAMSLRYCNRPYTLPHLINQNCYSSQSYYANYSSNGVTEECTERGGTIWDYVKNENGYAEVVEAMVELGATVPKDARTEYILEILNRYRAKQVGYNMQLQQQKKQFCDLVIKLV